MAGAESTDLHAELALDLARLVPPTAARWSDRELVLLVASDVHFVMRTLAADTSRLCASDPDALAAMLSRADAAISDGDRLAVEIVGVGLLVNVHNLLSHPDAACPPERFHALLPTHCRSLWDYLDELWQRVAATGARAPDALLQLGTVTNEDLWAATHCFMRRLPDGTWITMNEIAKHELATREGGLHIVAFSKTYEFLEAFLSP